jgi:predicted nucleic acid-binding Zn ribbon protein
VNDRDLAREVLEEFAAHGIGLAAEDVHVRPSSSPRGWGIEAAFDIENPAAMLAEQRRLETEVARRAACALLPKPARRRHAESKPCALCWTPTPQNTNPPRDYCSDKCRKRAHYLKRVAAHRCARCGALAEQGKTLCTPHLAAVIERQRKTTRPMAHGRHNAHSYRLRCQASRLRLKGPQWT